MRMYLVLWRPRTDSSPKWNFDGLFSDAETAKAKVTFESLHRPFWEHLMLPIEMPEPEP
jgi:hypothetical protein